MKKILFLATSCFIFGSCNKNDRYDNLSQTSEKHIFEQFTKVTQGLDPALQKIADKLNEKNTKAPFIVQVGRKVGLPLWSHAQFNIVHTNNVAARENEVGNQTVIIPLSLPNSYEVAGFIAALVDVNNNVLSICEYDKFNYFLLGYNKLATEIDAEDVVLQCLTLQKNVFNITKFKILDNKLFNTQQEGSTEQRKNFEISLLDTLEINTTSSRIRGAIVKHNHCIGHDGIGPGGHEEGDCDECIWCGEYSYDIVYYESPLDWGGGGFGGGGNWGGGWTGYGGSGNNGGSGNGGSNYDYDPNQPFNNLDYPINVPDDVIINNGIEIDDVDAQTLPNNLRQIAQTTPRGNVEDMQHGTNGDPSGISPNFLLQVSETYLFDAMTSLFNKCTYFDSDLRIIGDDFIQRFRNRTGGTYSNSVLNSKVSQSSALINFLKKFGEQLNIRLNQVGGNINNVTAINLSNDIRPVFNGMFNKFNGLQILINDTEFTKIQLDNFTIDVSGNWIAIVTVTIHDHFGLDKQDALKYQSWHQGFPSWWILQHIKDYVPFETIVTVRKSVYGHL